MTNTEKDLVCCMLDNEEREPEIYRQLKGASQEDVLALAGLGAPLSQENIDNIFASDSGYDISASSALLIDIGYDAGTPNDGGYEGNGSDAGSYYADISDTGGYDGGGSDAGGYDSGSSDASGYSGSGSDAGTDGSVV